MTDLEALVRLCPPPNSATHIDWNGIEAGLGMPLPDDYKALAERYGPGNFCDYLTLYHPHGPTEYVTSPGPCPRGSGPIYARTTTVAHTPCPTTPITSSPAV
ncbi:hypothetical protein ACFQX6_37470 [Streptosporangium lutulentum]